jgi:hypothetical protein
MKALLALLLCASTAAADDYAGGTVIFARGDALYRVDPNGRNETQVATLGSKSVVRALRTDAGGHVLLADIAGVWSWMPLDGSTKSLAELPCGDGPAQITEDASCAVCRAKAGAGSIVYNFKLAKAFPLDVAGTRIVGADKQRKLIWSEAGSIWSAPLGDIRKKTKVAAEAPLRGFLPSPDGARALGTYADEIYVDAHHKKAAEVLQNFALDGEAARRKVIKDGVAVEWSHDSQWTLVQDRANACLQKASGGEYKCWNGYTAASLSPDGRWILVLGNRDPRAAKPAAKTPAAKKKPVVEEPQESGVGGADEDVAVPLPTGPLALYRGSVEGAFTLAPTVIVKVVDGAAVWVPAAP